MPKPENLIGKGFDSRPENINRKGRPRTLISEINKKYKEEGYEAATVAEIKEAYLMLINMPLSEIIEISKKENDDHPLLYKLVAKELLGKRGVEMLEKLLDRALGKSVAQVDHTTQGEKVNQIHIFNIPDDGRNNE